MNSQIELSILMPAFLAGILVLAVHVPLGIEVLKRGIIFIDLAIAQVAGLGALAAMLVIPEDADGGHAIEVQVFSAVSALLGALLLTWTEKRFPDLQEALIGCLFVLSASAALLMLGQNPHGAEHMKDLLAGQILWVSYSQLGGVALLYTALLAVWFMFGKLIGRIGFYAIFALAVTASVQMVGVYLVFSSLIIPALAASRLEGKAKLSTAYITGIVGLAGGLLVSMLLDLATGPAIVCALAVAGVAGFSITSRK